VALIMAKDGKILARATGGVLATDCGGPSFNCSSPGIVGCRGCSCCCSRYYLVCIGGAAGDCAVINNSTSGWTLDNGGAGGSYSFQNASVKVTLELSTYVDPIWGPQGRCRDYELRAYRWTGTAWAECLSASGSDWEWTGLDGDCSVSGAAGGVSYSIKPTQQWWPERFRVTVSGANRCAATCTASTYSNFYYRVNSVSIDGVYDVTLDEIDAGDCIWRVLGVGSYSYSVWTASDCSGSPLRTITGHFNIMVQVNGSAQLSCTIRQDSSQHAVPGDEFSGFVTLPVDAACTSLNQALNDTDTRCPLAWGYWDTSYVRTFNGATVTVEALP
jgi:hypothetical protein